MKKHILSLDYGVFPSMTEDVSKKLQEFFDKNNNDCDITIAPGKYYLESFMHLKGYRNVNIYAYGVKFITKFNPTDPYSSSGAFRFENSEDCSIRGISFETENPANTTGRIINIDLKESTFDVKLEEGFFMRGDEWVVGLDTCDENLTPNKHIFFCNYDKSFRYKKIGNNVFRFYIWHTLTHHLKTASVGELICLRHTLFSTPPMNFIACKRFLLEDVTVFSSPGICCGIYPRSEDFTFRRFNVRLAHGSKQLLSSNTDGIHIKGLTGTLTMEDCHFEHMGDDALNIHNRAGTVFLCENNIIKTGLCTPTNSVNDLPVDLLPKEWAHKGDIIYIYDEDTIEKKGEITVEKFEISEGYNVISFSNLSGEIKPGYKLANSAYYAEVIIKNCSISGGRAKGFLIQSQNITVENCKFFGVNLAALMLCCDLKQWNEMGPAKNVVIKNNIFEECGIHHKHLRSGGIAIGVGHGNECESIIPRNGVHENIEIINNRFVNMKDSAIFADAVSGLEIIDNEMLNCCYLKEGRLNNYCYDVVLFNCENTIVNNNFNSYGEDVTVKKV